MLEWVPPDFSPSSPPVPVLLGLESFAFNSRRELSPQKSLCNSARPREVNYDFSVGVFVLPRMCLCSFPFPVSMNLKLSRPPFLLFYCRSDFGATWNAILHVGFRVLSAQGPPLFEIASINFDNSSGTEQPFGLPFRNVSTCCLYFFRLFLQGVSLLTSRPSPHEVRGSLRAVLFSQIRMGFKPLPGRRFSNAALQAALRRNFDPLFFTS